MPETSKNFGLFTDYYELSMAQGYFYAGKKDEQATFDYFFRTNPFKGGFLVFAGLGELIRILENFFYTDSDIEYLSKQGFNQTFLQFLKNVRFRGTLFSAKEGEIIFPIEPVIRVEGNIIEAQLIETVLLNTINFQSLIATKAFRISLVSRDKPFSDFGLRRAHGDGGIQASRAAIIGGASSTSNVYAGQLYDIPVDGTMAHSWVQSFDDELTAFRDFANTHPDNSVLLVDTYNTLKSGVPNAIKVAKEMEEKGLRLTGIRIDSGDLSYLSKRAREMMDKEDLHYVKIFVSNQLNEYVVNSLAEQRAPIDAFGIGTELVTGKPEAAVDGVYKLSECNFKPRMKLSDNISKMTLPGKKNVYRYSDRNGMFCCDGILLEDEDPDEAEIIYHPFDSHKRTCVNNMKRERMLEKVFESGKSITQIPSPQECHNYLKEREKLLPEEHKRFIQPHVYKCGISRKLFDLREDIIKQYSN